MLTSFSRLVPGLSLPGGGGNPVTFGRENRIFGGSPWNLVPSREIPHGLSRSFGFFRGLLGDQLPLVRNTFFVRRLTGRGNPDFYVDWRGPVRNWCPDGHLSKAQGAFKEGVFIFAGNIFGKHLPPKNMGIGGGDWEYGRGKEKWKGAVGPTSSGGFFVVERNQRRGKIAEKKKTYLVRVWFRRWARGNISLER